MLKQQIDVDERSKVDYDAMWASKNN